MQSLFLFIIMIFVYPVILFTSLHVIKGTYELKYTLFQIWSNFMLKRASSKVECKNSDLIPLENDYVFVVNHENKLDICLLTSALPVRTHFICDKTEKVPYLNVYLKRLKSIFVSYKNVDFSAYLSQFEDGLNESSLTIFLNTLSNEPLPSNFYTLAKQQKWTLIPVSIKNSANLLKKGKYHKVEVEIKVPLYFEEYGNNDIEVIQKLINERLKEVY